MAALTNPKRERFCREYVKDLNATQAASRAGYSVATAKQQGSRLLTDADVRARVAELQAKIAQASELTQESVVSDLKRIKELAIADRAYAPAAKAAELLGRHIGMWPTKIEANINLLERLTDDEQRAVRAALEAIARDKGEDAEGAAPTHH